MTTQPCVYLQARSAFQVPEFSDIIFVTSNLTTLQCFPPVYPQALGAATDSFNTSSSQNGSSSSRLLLPPGLTRPLYSESTSPASSTAASVPSSPASSALPGSFFTDSANHTKIEFSGVDRPGVLSDVTATLAAAQCNVVAAETWTHKGRVASILYVTDASAPGGGQLRDEARLQHIQAELGKVVSPVSDGECEACRRESPCVVADAGGQGSNVVSSSRPLLGMAANGDAEQSRVLQSHTERRLHQLLRAHGDGAGEEARGEEGERGGRGDKRLGGGCAHGRQHHHGDERERPCSEGKNEMHHLLLSAHTGADVSGAQALTARSQGSSSGAQTDGAVMLAVPAAPSTAAEAPTAIGAPLPTIVTSLDSISEAGCHSAASHHAPAIPSQLCTQQQQQQQQIQQYAPSSVSPSISSSSAASSSTSASVLSHEDLTRLGASVPVGPSTEGSYLAVTAPCSSLRMGPSSSSSGSAGLSSLLQAEGSGSEGSPEAWRRRGRRRGEEGEWALRVTRAGADSAKIAVIQQAWREGRGRGKARGGGRGWGDRDAADISQAEAVMSGGTALSGNAVTAGSAEQVMGGEAAGSGWRECGGQADGRVPAGGPPPVTSGQAQQNAHVQKLHGDSSAVRMHGARIARSASASASGGNAAALSQAGNKGEKTPPVVQGSSGKPVEGVHQSRHGSNGVQKRKRRAAVEVSTCADSQYLMVTVRCRDRPRLLFDTVCTLTDMQYAVHHGHADSADGWAFQVRAGGWRRWGW